MRLVATLGVLIVLQGLAGQKLWDTDFHQIDQFLPTHNYTLHEWFGFDGELGRVVVQQDRLILVGIAIVLTVRAVGLHAVHDGSGSRSRRAPRTSARVSALGWSPNFLATVTWAIGGATAGLAGILLAPNAGLSLTVFTIVVTVSALAVALIGGFSRSRSRLLGGIALGIAESEVLTYSTDISNFLHDTFGIENGATGLQRALPFLVIVVVLVVRGKALPLRSHVLERLPDVGSGVVTRWFLVSRRRHVVAARRVRVRRPLVDCVVHLADRRRVHPVDRRADGLRGTAVVGAVRHRWTVRAVRVASRRRRALAGGARIPGRCGVRHRRRACSSRSLRCAPVA